MNVSDIDMIFEIIGTICFIMGTTSPSILVIEMMDSLALWGSVEFFAWLKPKGGGVGR